MAVEFQTKGRKTDFLKVDKSSEYEALPERGDPIDCELPHGAELGAMGLVLPANLAFEQWQAIGVRLCIMDKSLQWAIGDWWAYGFFNYGERKAFATAGKLPFTFGTLMNLGCLARSIPPSRRNEVVSISHHIAVAPEEPDDQRKWLARAADKEWSVSKLREEMREQRYRDLADSPGMGKSAYAASWLSNYMQRAERAVDGCTFPHLLEPIFLDENEMHDIVDLIEATSKAARAWNTVTKELKAYQRERSSKPKPSASKKSSPSGKSRKHCEVKSLLPPPKISDSDGRSAMIRVRST